LNTGSQLLLLDHFTNEASKMSSV